MSFNFVDRIIEHNPAQSLRAIKNVCRNESLFYWLPSGQRALSPAVVSEAAAQTGAWLIMAATDFKYQPILLSCDDAKHMGAVQPGDQIEMRVQITDLDLDRMAVASSGQAFVNGEKVYHSDCSRGYLLPIEDFRDPVLTEKRFQDLYKPDLAEAHLDAEQGVRLKAIAGFQKFEALRFLDGLLHHTPEKKVVSYKNVTACETYFYDHFPRKPVVPGVMLLTVVGETNQYLLKRHPNAPIRDRALIPESIANVRFRRFVEPGDRLITTVEVVGGDPTQHGGEVAVKAVMHANGSRVLQAMMNMRVQHASEYQPSESGDEL